MLSPEFRWDEKSEAILRASWAAGRSATECTEDIYDALGMAPSRSAICGKVSRLGLDGRRSVPNRTPKPRRPRTAPDRRLPGPAEFPVLQIKETPPPAPPLHLHLVDIGHNQCRWPFGDGPFTFCGHPVADDKPYCAGHWRIGNAGRPNAR